MKTITKTVEELIKTKDSPLPLEVIPNNMGINLCSVEALTWTRKDDGQLVNLSIHFKEYSPCLPTEEIKKDAPPRFGDYEDDNAGPGEEDGPWAEGWDERSGKGQVANML